MEPWRVYRPVVADSRHYEEELDLDPHYSDADPQHSFCYLISFSIVHGRGTVWVLPRERERQCGGGKVVMFAHVAGISVWGALEATVIL